MPYEITLKTPIDGISVSHFESGENGEVLSTGFLRDSHTEFFYSVLDQFQNLFLQSWAEKGLPFSLIDNFLILIQGYKATVFINEANVVCETIGKSSIEKGQPVFLKDIIGITSLRFPEINIPEDNSIIYYFSIGWKRGVFFDFRPNTGMKLQDLEYILGSYYETLLYSHIYQYNQEIWQKVFKLGWFPFITLLGDADKHLKQLIGRIEENKSTNLVEGRLLEFFNFEKLNVIKERVANNEKMIPHQKIIETGIERYLAEDYVSAINNIYPRIEGILRYIFMELGNGRPNHKKLADNIYEVIENQTISPGVFYPEEFRNYLLSFYFRDFDLESGRLDVSRHSIGHGVSDVNLYDKKHALIGILIIDQLGFYLRRPITKQER